MPRTRSLAWAELKIGLMSIFALVMATILIFLLSGSGGFFWQRYSLKTVFANIAGLKEGAPVRVAGVEVGSVRDLNFIGDRVEVVMEVNKDHRSRITSTSIASLGSVSLLGEAAVDITASSSGTPVPEWGYVPSGRATGTIGDVAVQASTAIEQATALVNDLRAGRGTMGLLLTDEQLYNRLNSLSDRIDKVMAGLQQGEGTAGQLLRDRQLYENMNGTMAELKSLVSDIRKDPKKYLNVKVSLF